MGGIVLLSFLSFYTWIHRVSLHQSNTTHIQFKTEKHNEQIQMFQWFLLVHAVLVFLAADIIQLPFFKLHNKPRQKSATKAPTTNSSLGNAHTDATTHRVAAVDEVVALRGEAAQQAVLLLRWRGPAHPSPQPAAAQSAVRGNRQNFEHRNIVASDASD